MAAATSSEDTDSAAGTMHCWMAWSHSRSSMASGASITYSKGPSPFSTSVFSRSGISSADVSRTWCISMQNSPFLGFSDWNTGNKQGFINWNTRGEVHHLKHSQKRGFSNWNTRGEGGVHHLKHSQKRGFSNWNTRKNWASSTETQSKTGLHQLKHSQKWGFTNWNADKNRVSPSETQAKSRASPTENCQKQGFGG